MIEVTSTDRSPWMPLLIQVLWITGGISAFAVLVLSGHLRTGDRTGDLALQSKAASNREIEQMQWNSQPNEKDIIYIVGSQEAADQIRLVMDEADMERLGSGVGLLAYNVISTHTPEGRRAAGYVLGPEYLENEDNLRQITVSDLRTRSEYERDLEFWPLPVDR